LIGGIDATTRSKARAAILHLLHSGGGGASLRRRRRPLFGRRARRVAFGAVLVAVLVAAATVGGLALLLSWGPINLESLNPRIASSLQERLGPRYVVSIGPTSLMRGGGGVVLGFGGIAIHDSAGRPVLSAPSGRVGLDLWSLLTLEIKVHRLELDGLDLRLTVRPDGALSVAAAADADAATIDLPAPIPPGAESTAGPDFGLVAIGLIDAMTGASQSLDRLALAHGHLEVLNEALGKRTVYDDFQLTFAKIHETATISVGAKGPQGRWSVDAKASGGAERTVSLTAHDLGFDDIRLFNAHRPPFEADMPISLRLEAKLGANSAIETMQGRFTLGAGYFKLDDPDHEPFLIDEATGDMAWDPAARRYRFDNLQLLSGATHVYGAGWTTPPTRAEPAWISHFESDDAVFAAERPGEKPITIQQATLDAHFYAGQGRLVLDRLTVQGPTVNGSATAETNTVPGGATLKLNLQVGPSAVVDLLRLWPSFINADARAWCIQNIHGGQLLSASMKIDWDAAAFDLAAHKKAVPADSVLGEMTGRDVVVDLMPGLPPLTVAEASARITGRQFSANAKTGVVELSPTRRVQASDIVYQVPDTAPAAVVPAKANAHLQGAADALVDLLGRDALKHYAGFSLDPTLVKGQFDGDLAIDLKLGKSVRPEDQQFRASGTLANLRVDRFLANERLDQGALSVDARQGVLKITGQGQIYGAPVAIDVTKGATDEGVIALAFTLDGATRAKLGVPVAAMLSGPTPIRLKAPLSKSGAELEIDLTRVSIDSPQTGPLKAAGKPGKATLDLKPDADGGAAVTSIVVDAGGLAARGSAQFASDGALVSAKLTQLRLSAGDELHVDLQDSPGALKATVRGVAFDARTLIKGLLGAGGPPGAGKDIDVDVKIATVMGANSQPLKDLELTGVWRGSLAAMQAKARIGEGTLSAQQDELGVLRARVTDAGAMARFLDIYARMEGGTLALTLQQNAEGGEGSANIADFVLRDEPALRQLAAAGQGAGEAGIALGPAPDSSSVRFDKMSAAFTRTPGRLALREAVIFNRNVGLTTEGYLDFAHDHVDLNGTYVPAYQVNSLVTHIPVFGPLLGGGQHEGLFGVNYRIVGPASGPTLYVNPLSAMTPGFLRKIFGAVDGTTPAIAAPPDPVGQGQSRGFGTMR
jgi:hypothetical protein